MHRKLSSLYVLALLACGCAKVHASEGDRHAQIRARMKKATPCPWFSDGEVSGWWGGERPGVMIRAKANVRCTNWDSGRCIAGTDGGPVAEVGSDVYSGSHNPVADAEFIAHACSDIEYLLEESETKKAE
jgi:hypothetical protein